MPLIALQSTFEHTRRKYTSVNFVQDLDEDDIMVLDSGDEIYVWVGNKSSSEERQLGMKMAEV